MHFKLDLLHLEILNEILGKIVCAFSERFICIFCNHFYRNRVDTEPKRGKDHLDLFANIFIG